MIFPKVNVLMIMSSLYKTEVKVEFKENNNPIFNSLFQEKLTIPDKIQMGYGD